MHSERVRSRDPLFTACRKPTSGWKMCAGTIKPQFATPAGQSKLYPFAEKLAGWLKAAVAKYRKQRRTLK